MPRQRGGGRSAPSRPSVAPQRSAPAPQQTRQSSTAARPAGAPPAQTAPPQQQSGGGGMFANIASTAAGVAIGSSVGHALGGLFGGGSSEQVQQADSALQAQSSNQTLARTCDVDAKAFTNCLDQNQGEHSMSICGWYLEQLKACQQAATQYGGQQ